MSPTEASTETIRHQLDRILAGRGFVGNERLSKFLRFVVEQQLLGKADELKESLVGIEVFGRTPGFDPRQDSVVRTEAARLRVRLSQYYAGEGTGDPVVIELPKGGYTPVFRQPEAAGEKTPPGRISSPSRLGTRLWLTITLASLALVLAAGGSWWVGHKSAPIAIAVLPLNNLSEDPANDYFADALTSEIIRNLSIIDGLAVRDFPQMIAGSLLVAVLAVAADLLLAGLQKLIVSPGLRAAPGPRRLRVVPSKTPDAARAA